MASEEPQSISALYQAAEAARADLDSQPALSPSFADDLSSCITLHTRLLASIGQVSLFSDNETLEDVNTSSLPYLLVDYHLAELYAKTPARQPAERKEVVAKARGSYERFLTLVEGYELLYGTPEKALWERYKEEGERFEMVAGKDPNARRNGKIEAFKHEKAMREKLEYLKRDPRYVERGGDEELVRDVYLAEITLTTHKALQALDGLNRECEILAMAPTHPNPSSPTTPTNPDDVILSRLDNPLRPQGSLSNPNGPLLSQKGKPLQPFTLVGNRAELSRGVFRPGHNLPTMSIDEYLDEEMARGGMVKGGEESGRIKVVDEDDEAEVDKETYKAREWDEFKDHNRYGAGNTMNMG